MFFDDFRASGALHCPCKRHLKTQKTNSEKHARSPKFSNLCERATRARLRTFSIHLNPRRPKIWLGECPDLDGHAPQQFKRVDCFTDAHISPKNARKLHKNCSPIIWCCACFEMQRTVRDGKVGDGKRTVGNYCIRKKNCVIFFQKNWGNFWGR